jgi:hypothetical protein
MSRQAIWLILLFPALFAGMLSMSGCDQISERAGFPDPARLEAEGKAIGGACRHAGRGLEDCYRLNKLAEKAAVYAGWKEMNEYMVKNNMQAVEPVIPPDKPPSRRKAKTDDAAESQGEPAASDATDTNKAVAKEK